METEFSHFFCAHDRLELTSLPVLLYFLIPLFIHKVVHFLLLLLLVVVCTNLAFLSVLEFKCIVISRCLFVDVR